MASVHGVGRSGVVAFPGGELPGSDLAALDQSTRGRGFEPKKAGFDDRCSDAGSVELAGSVNPLLTPSNTASCSPANRRRPANGD